MIELATVSFVLGVVFGILIRASTQLALIVSIFLFGWAIGAKGGWIRYGKSLICLDTLVIWAGFAFGVPFGYFTTDWIVEYAKTKRREAISQGHTQGQKIR